MMNEVKKKRKRVWIVAALVLLLVCCGMLAACGGGGDGAETEAAQEETKATVRAGDLVDNKSDTPEEASKAETTASTAENAAAEESGQHGAAYADEGAGSDTSADNGGSSSSGKNSGKSEAANVCYVSVDEYCSGMEVSWSSGDTAYSVLKKTGAKVSARKTQYGMYVEGINGLFEFDKGDASGWMYSVDGVVPNKSADKYKVKKGAYVEWYYVTGE